LDKNKRTETDWLVPDRLSQTDKKSTSKARYIAMKELLAKEKEVSFYKLLIIDHLSFRQRDNSEAKSANSIQNTKAKKRKF